MFSLCSEVERTACKRKHQMVVEWNRESLFLSVSVSQIMDPGPPNGRRELSGHSTQQKGLLLCQTCLRAHFALSALLPSCLSQWDGEEEDDVLMERRERICPSLRSH